MQIKIDESCYDARYKDTYFLIEATDFEHQILWERNQARLLSDPKTGVQWDEDSMGINQGIREIKIGKKTEQVFISVRWAKLNGLRVCFWHPSSQVVHHGMIEKWFKKHCLPTHDNGRESSVDAVNFPNCLIPIQDPKTWKLKRHGQK